MISNYSCCPSSYSTAYTWQPITSRQEAFSFENSDHLTAQEKIELIKQQQERNNNNIGHGLGVMLRTSYYSVKSKISTSIRLVTNAVHFYFSGNTELHVAALFGDLEAIKACTTSDTLVNSVNTKGETPLMLAAQLGNVEITRTLFTLGANPRATDSKGNNCMHHAAQSANVELIKLCLLYQVPLDSFNAAQYTPLMVAVQHGQPAVVTFLLNSGADITKKSAQLNAESAFELALSTKNDKVIDIFIQKGTRSDNPASQVTCLHQKNWETILFEKTVRTLLTHPTEHKSITFTNPDDQSHVQSKIFHAIQWEAVHFAEQEYELLKINFTSVELELMRTLDTQLQKDDFNTNNFRHSFGTNYTSKYRNLNKVDRFLIHSMTRDMGYKINDLLGEVTVHYPVDLMTLLPRMAFLANALNKIEPDHLTHFACRGQIDQDKNNRLKNPMFVSVSRIYSACHLYATKGQSAKRYGGGHVVFFKNLIAYDISGLSSVPFAAEYITFPRIITYSEELLSGAVKKNSLPYYFGHTNPSPSSATVSNTVL